MSLVVKSWKRGAFAACSSCGTDDPSPTTVTRGIFSSSPLCAISISATSSSSYSSSSISAPDLGDISFRSLEGEKEGSIKANGKWIGPLFRLRMTSTERRTDVLGPKRD